MLNVTQNLLTHLHAQQYLIRTRFISNIQSKGLSCKQQFTVAFRGSSNQMMPILLELLRQEQLHRNNYSDWSFCGFFRDICHSLRRVTGFTTVLLPCIASLMPLVPVLHCWPCEEEQVLMLRECKSVYHLGCDEFWPEKEPKQHLASDVTALPPLVAR